MYKYLTSEQVLTYNEKLKKNNEILAKKQAKINLFNDNQYKLLEKQFQKATLKYEQKKVKLAEKEKRVIEKLEIKYSNKPEKLVEKNKISDSLIKLFEKRKNDLEINFDITTQNYELAKKDVDEGLEASSKYNEKIYIRTLEKKFAKLDFSNSFKEKKGVIINENPGIDKKELKIKLSAVKEEIYNESNKEYKPFSLVFRDNVAIRKDKFKIALLNFKIKWLNAKNWTFKEWLTVEIWTIPAYLLIAFVGILVATILTGIVEANMIYAMAILLTMSIVFGSVFAKIPIWNKYFGGALLGCMFVGSMFVYFNVFPKSGPVYITINDWFKTQDFLSMYISVLLVGAVLLIPRKMIIKATGGFFTLIVIGTLFATALGVAAAYATGMSMKTLILDYWLPILCDGNGGGIQPIGKIAEQNGYDSGDWMSKALAISTIASVLSVLMSAVLNGLGKVKTSLSGEGKLVRRDIHTVERPADAKDRNIAAGLLLILMIYLGSDILAKAIFTEDLIKILVPNFAWMIVIGIAINLANCIPVEMKKGVDKVNKFIAKQTTWLLMLAVGIIYIDLNKFISALNATSLLLCFAFVLGAAIGPLLTAKLFRFYAIESAVSAGLCMTAQGGSGAIMVLGTSERMDLMPWGQITCRIAGSLILIFAGIAFATYPAETTAAVAML